MKKYRFILLFVFAFTSKAFSQNDSTDVDDDGQDEMVMKKGFQVGFLAGTYLANNYSAALYNGYGVDVYGHTNTFFNSLMFQQIVNYNGGYNGYTDRIAQALGVNHGDWQFNESDMPYHVRYNIAFTAGIQMRYAVTFKDAILLNASTSRINVAGAFTIETPNTYSINGTPGQNTERTCSLAGSEQRTVIQLGYQRNFGDSTDRLSFFMEGGMNVNLAKLMKNQININGLVLDLTSVYSMQYANYSAFNSKYLSGVGIGFFAGAGININISKVWLMQLVYQPSFDKINIGAAPKYSFQNTLGIRGYFCF